MKKYSFIINFSIGLGLAFVFIGLKLCFSDKLSGREYGLGGLKHHQEAQLVILGASHVNSSFDPQIISSMAGINTYLLHYPRMNILEIEVLLKQLIKEGLLKNKILLIDVFPKLFTTAPKLFSIDYFYDLPFSEKITMTELYWNLYSGKNLSFWIELLISGFNEDIVAYPLNSIFQDQTHIHGMKITNKEGMSQESYEAYQPKKTLSSKLHAVYVIALVNVCEMLKQNGFRPIFIDTPYLQSYAKNAAVTSVKTQLNQIITGCGGVFLDTGNGFHYNYPERDLFYDEDHLSSLGRTIHSKHFVSDLLKDVEP